MTEMICYLKHTPKASELSRIANSVPEEKGSQQEEETTIDRVRQRYERKNHKPSMPFSKAFDI